MTFRYMLDSNTIGHLLRSNANVEKRLSSISKGMICISSVVEGEIHYGLAKRPEAHRLAFIVEEFLRRIESVPWDSKTARSYGKLRAKLERSGKVLSPMDMLIAAHALSLGLILVTGDRAFQSVDELTVEDWTKESIG